MAKLQKVFNDSRNLAFVLLERADAAALASLAFALAGLLAGAGRRGQDKGAPDALKSL